MVVKNGSWPAANGAASLVVFRGCDARLTNCIRNGVIVAHGAWQLHNYALIADGGIWGVTGETSAKHPATLTLRAHTREDKKWLQHAYGPTLSMDHPGCVERRQGYDGQCLFDGRFSLASASKRVLKAWFDEHLDSPYPTPKEKSLLARSAGLSIKQVNDWFTNYRKRHWEQELVKAQALDFDDHSASSGSS